MRRILCAAAFAVASVTAGPAVAHQGNPNMQSVVKRVTPVTAGVRIEVLNRDDRFELANRSGKQLVVYGYDGDEYARLQADGTVQVNTNSPAYYLNEDRYADVSVPPSVNPRAAPHWKTLDRTGRFQWHDHRMHYMGKGVPSSVKDRSERQRIFDYEIPIEVGSRRGSIDGTLFWTPEPGGGPPLAAIASLIVLVAFSAVVVVRRRRGMTAARKPRRAGNW